jgi:predicted ribosome quality control (RQC) complex YloA/Tae2 family protein
MESYEMSSLDYRFLVKELNKMLVGGYFRKIYQYEAGEKTHQFLFEIFIPNKGNFWLFCDKNKLFITKYKKPSPMKPPDFCMLLRKHLEGSKILEIRQHEFDRIIEISAEKHVLIIELFSDGNVILCDSRKKIVMPLYSQEWKDREVKPKIPYVYPPPRINPFSVSFEYFREFIARSEKKIIAVLAAGFGFGPAYAKEVCVRSMIDETIPSERLSSALAVQLFNKIRDIDTFSFEPTLYENLISPFPLQNPEAGEKKRQLENFSEALDEFFSEQQVRMAEDFEGGVHKKHRDKFERIIKDQESSLQKWSKKRVEKKSQADLIYTHYERVEKVLDAVNRMKTAGMKWSAIKAAMKELPEARVVKAINEREGKLTLELEGQPIELDFRKSIVENAAEYYEKSKLAKRKIAGVHEALEKTRKKLEEKPKETQKIEKFVKIEKKEKKWFEKFRWFTSSDGFLVVGGKDATSNEVLIKKYAEAKDLVFHADIYGSPFVVIKAQGRDIPPTTKKEAAEFAGTYSSAWRSSLGTVDVYCIKSEQVSKQPRPGEYLAKGAFMVYGEREWFRNSELKIAIGVKIDRQNKTVAALAGPVSSVKANADYSIIVKPGEKSSSEVARMIKSMLAKAAKEGDRPFIEALPASEIQKFVPLGTGEVILDNIFRF